MKRMGRAALAAAVVSVSCPVAAVAEQGAPAWGFAGATGPANWGRLAAEYATCGDGSAQSPIDLGRSEEPSSQLQSLMRSSYAVFCLNKKQHRESTPYSASSKQSWSKQAKHDRT